MNGELHHPASPREFPRMILASSRGVDETGFKANKTQEQQERYLHRSQYLEVPVDSARPILPQVLERCGLEANLDHRSYQRGSKKLDAPSRPRTRMRQ
jgi:hypothetical protein